MTRREPGLDARNPWVLDTRELPRGPGSMREVSRVAPAPDDLGTDIIAVPKGADVHFDVRMESVSEGVWVSGTASGMGVGECSRCLEPVELPMRVTFNELFAYPGTDLDDPDDPDGPDVSQLTDDLIDLMPVVRDAIVLGFPLSPLCRAECRGLCSECGIRLDDLGDEADEHGHETMDPRWAALSSITTVETPIKTGNREPEES